MPIIITVHFQHEAVRTCGPPCYLGLPYHTLCVCGGRNRKKGLDRAVQNNRQYEKEITAAIYRRFPNAVSVQITTTLRDDLPGQQKLFPPQANST